MMDDNRMIDAVTTVVVANNDSPAELDQGVGENSNSNVPTPLSATMLDECSETPNNTLYNQQPSNNLHTQRQHSASPLSFEGGSSSSSNATAGRFRRHSSQSASLINIPLNLSLNSSYAAGAAPNITASGPISSGGGGCVSNGLMSPLTVTSTGVASNGNATERVCSSPINSLKMSSRVCQIKIDEGIEPHLNREIKSERETQNTLKLKSSCDELMINNDELESLTFDRQLMDPSPHGGSSLRQTNSPNFLINGGASGGTGTTGAALPGLNGATFRRYRTFSESYNQTISNINGNGAGNVPSPSTMSCSYSNSSSPTGGLGPNPFGLPLAANSASSHSGLLRCFSPSTANTMNTNSGTNNSNSGNNHLHQSSPSPAQPPTVPSPGLSTNYFSQSPSPTRKLFVTRRSMSPVTCTLRPSSLGLVGPTTASTASAAAAAVTSGGSAATAVGSNKRKFSDIDQQDLNNSSSLLSLHSHSPKRSNLETQQEFVQPLLIFTGSIQHLKTRSATSSPSPSPLSVASSSSSPPPVPTPTQFPPPPPPPPPPLLPPVSTPNSSSLITSVVTSSGVVGTSVASNTTSAVVLNNGSTGGQVGGSIDQDDVNVLDLVVDDDSDSVSSSSPSMHRRRPILQQQTSSSSTSSTTSLVSSSLTSTASTATSSRYTFVPIQLPSAHHHHHQQQPSSTSILVHNKRISNQQSMAAVIPNTSIAQLSLANNNNNNNTNNNNSTMTMTPNSTDSPSMVGITSGGEIFACDSPPRSLVSTFSSQDSPTVVSDGATVAANNSALQTDKNQPSADAYIS